MARYSRSRSRYSTARSSYSGRRSNTRRVARRSYGSARRTSRRSRSGPQTLRLVIEQAVQQAIAQPFNNMVPTSVGKSRF